MIVLIVGSGARGQSLLFRNLTIQQGLAQNSVIAIAEDKRGFIWLGTRYGLSRYDGYRFRNYMNDPADSNSLPDNQVSTMLTDAEGTLWVSCIGRLCKYDEKMERFRQVPYREGRLGALNAPTVDVMYEDQERNLWMGTREGLNLVTDRDKNQFINRFRIDDSMQAIGRYANAVFQTSDGALWIGTSQGLARFIYHNGKVSGYRVFQHKPEDPQSPEGNHITAINEDKDHHLWVGTLNDGISVFDYNGGVLKRVKVEGLVQPAVIGGNVRRLLPDRQGRMWVGTQNGLYIYDPSTKSVTVYQHDPDRRASLNTNSIYSLYHDKNGTTWVGTYHGGVNIAYRYATPFTVFQNDHDPHSLNYDVVSDMVEDDRHNLWIGTEGGGLNYLDRSKGSFQHFKNVQGDSTSISSNFIKCIYRDASGHIWIGTSYNGDLNRLDAKTNRFEHYFLKRTGERTSVNFDEVLAIREDPNGSLLIGCLSGLYELKKRADGSFERVAEKVSLRPDLDRKSVQALLVDSHKNLWIGGLTGLHLKRAGKEDVISFTKNVHPDSLHERNINFIREDSKGTIWIGTYYGGLYQYDDKGRRFVNYTQKEGLPNNNILGMLEDKRGGYWISTENGLSRFDPREKTFKNYTVSDGIAGNKFNQRSFFKDSQGELFFGGNNGLTAFYPERVQLNRYVGDLVFTSLKLAGNTVGIQGEDHLLQRSIASTDRVAFRHDQRMFTIGFALLNYVKPEKNRYGYKLEGFEDKWNYTNDPYATYSNLPDGSYTLLVKAANNDGFWTGEPARMQIVIRPPFWRTWWAYALYLLAAGGVIFLLVRFLYLRALFKKEHMMQQFKLNFFTNISHEIRTHLSLVSIPVEQLMQVRSADPYIGRKLQQVKTYTDRLTQLINELMDFRKAETNNLPLHVQEMDIVSFLSAIFHSFHDLARSREISYSIRSLEKEIPVYFDKLQLEKVIFNLLTNAFKFTPDGGAISLEVDERPDEVSITVKDNGKGIAPENLKKIFTNFFQVNEDPSQNMGYGIGLALSRSLIELHRGTLSVTSTKPVQPTQLGNTIFCITLLKGHAHFKPSELKSIRSGKPLAADPEAIVQEGRQLATTAEGKGPVAEERKPLILLVEDNVELRSFLRESFDLRYTVSETSTGAEGWEVATEQIPDLIISDVMMPGMDGYAFCRRLKSDERTSHIPVILLTAKAASEHQLEGLEMGADVYLTKPFSLRVVELHIHNLLTSRAALREKYSRRMTLGPKEVELNPIDENFLIKVMDIIEEHMDDAEFGVAVLAKKVAMSPPVLYKKLKSLTDMTVNDFIKSVRLKKAALLLQRRQLTIAEVAYTVGFSRREYFSEEFKKQFGQSPSEYIKGFS